MSSRRVYISYARRDAAAFVARLGSDLSNLGVDVWWDLQKVAPGEDFMDAIVDAIESASAFLYLESPCSQRPESWMNKEVEIALARSIPVIPLELPGVDPTQRFRELQGFAFLNFQGSYEEGFQQLLGCLERCGLVDAVKPTESNEAQSKGYVFISYAEEDSEFVAHLKEFLKTQRYGYWDYSESDRDYHGQFCLELEGVIANASAMLSVLSEDWKRSNWTIREYFFSNEVKVPVFLLRARAIGPTLAIAGTPYIDFVIDRPAGFAKLHRELVRKGL